MKIKFIALFFAIAPQVLAESPSGENSQSLRACTEIADDSKRLECFDEVAGRIFDIVDQQPRNRIGIEDEFSDEISEAVIGETAQGITHTTISSVSENAYGKPIYTTEDGRRWQKSSSSRGTPVRVGTRVHFEDGSFSSIFMVTEDGRRIKVRPL